MPTGKLTSKSNVNNIKLGFFIAAGTALFGWALNQAQRLIAARTAG